MSRFKRKKLTKKPKIPPNDSLLPTCLGPKMYPFKDQNPTIEFKRPLGNVTEDEIGESYGSNSEAGGQGYVFEASINSEIYAIKLFKFFNMQQERLHFSTIANEKMTDEDFIGNVDPFFAECRAYGCVEEFYQKIRERNKEYEPIAVPCYGYLYISAHYERIILETFGIGNWNRQDQSMEPIRALVKKFIPSEDAINKKERSILRMRNDLKKLHEIGVYPRDIFARNYRDGLIVDFGIALTNPSCVLAALNPKLAKAEVGDDFKLFDNMIANLGVKTRVKAFIPTHKLLTRSTSADQGDGPKFMELDPSGKSARYI